MFISIDETKSLLNDLTKRSLHELNLADVDQPYLTEVDDTDVDNTHNMLNIWVCMYEDKLQLPSSILIDYIKRIGLVTVILEAKELRLQFIQSSFDYSIFQTGTPWVHFRPSFRKHIPETDVLQILGFPVRLFFRRSNLGSLAIRGFRDVNKGFADRIINEKEDTWNFKEFANSNFNLYSVPVSKVLEGSPDPTIRFVSSSKLMVFALMKRFIAEILGDFPNLNSFILPPASTYELRRKSATYYNKYEVLTKYGKWIQEFIPLPDNYFMNSKPGYEVPSFIGRLITVPKNVGSGRTVLPEEVARQFVGYAYVEGLYESLEKYPYSAYAVGDFDGIEGVDSTRIHVGNLDVTNQGRNQALAKLGSENNLLATMDMSRASDTISVDMCKYLLPEEHYSFLSDIRAQWIELPDGNIIRNNIMFTMGFSATYVIETAIYTAMARTAVELTWNWADEESRKYFRNINRALAFCFSVGDDVIIPSFAADAFRMVCECCGCYVNMDKSYWDGPYRESCGKEYYDGYDITCSYYPRGTSSTRLAELIGLQHKLVDYPLVNAFIIHKCGQYRKHLTTNAIGTKYMDIWDITGPDVILGYSKYQCNTGSLYLKAWSSITELPGISKSNIENNTTVRLTGVTKDPNLNTYKWKGLEFSISSDRTPVLGGSVDIKSYTITPMHSDRISRIRMAGKKSFLEDITNWRDIQFTPDITGGVDEEPYCQVTVPQISFSAVNTSVQPWEVERLAYVMSLYEMSHRPKFTTDEYLVFCIDRSYNQSSQRLPWQDDFGIILPSDMRKSLCATSSTKLVRRIVPIQD